MMPDKENDQVKSQAQPRGGQLPEPKPPEPYTGVKLYRSQAWEIPVHEPNDWTVRIAEIMLSENLVVLTGLGTSLCLNTEGQPSVAPKMSDLWAAVVAIQGFEAVRSKVAFNADSADVEALLSHCQLYLALTPGATDVETFVNLAEAKIHDLCNFVQSGTILENHQLFLRKLARRSIRQPRLKLFTTNYDRCFEEAAARTGFISIDGFSHSMPQQFDGSYFGYDLVRREVEGTAPDFIPNVFQYFKLHGSVDWFFDDGNRVVKGSGQRRAMIFPRYGKFESSYQQPFFEMMARLQMALRQPNTGLLVIGYGCNDQHLNEPLLTALRGNVGLRCAMVDPVLETNCTSGVRGEFKRLIDAGDTRLMLLSTTFEAFVEHVPDLVAATEGERHFERTRGK
jgi:hypothetical protein